MNSSTSALKSRSFHDKPSNSPPSYLQPTLSSHTKQTKSPSKQPHLGRSFIYKQENINGPSELLGRKKILQKDDSNGSLLALMEKSDPYKPSNKPISPHKPDKNSYRVYMPEFNCETPKFQGLRTYYRDFVNIDPVCNKVMGGRYNEAKERGNIRNTRRHEGSDKENTIPCLPTAKKERQFGKKTFKNHHFTQDNNIVIPLNDGDEMVLKRPMKKQGYRHFQASDLFKPEQTQHSPLRSVENLLNRSQPGILPLGEEKTPVKKELRYPNQRRILEGDALFWRQFNNRERENFVKNERKVTNQKYNACVEWIKQEKQSLDRYLRHEENLPVCDLSRESRKKQFPQSPIFKTNIALG